MGGYSDVQQIRMGISGNPVYRDSIHRLCIGLRNLFTFDGGMKCQQ
jgi:hypothetical protein